MRKMMTAKQAAETPLAYSFDLNYQAHDGLKGQTRVIVPDQVVENQKHYSSTMMCFPVRMFDGRYKWARLNGEAYGLWTSGTGDMIVSPPRWKRVRS
jgi:hypothetical protein